MSKFFHLGPILKSVYYGQRWRLKRLLSIADKPHTDVLNSGLDSAVIRYRRICHTLLNYFPNKEILRDSTVAEIGCGDCLAAADMMLGLGAKHVHLVELIPMVVSEKHSTALDYLIEDPALPNSGDVLAKGEPPRLNSERVTFHEGLLENIRIPESVDFLYSFDVLEHVDDLDGFFAYCGEVVKPKGLMMHKFDLSGHGLFEDPMPPLDFQAMPEWLFNFAFPKFNRAAGNFADEFYTAMEKHGFKIIDIIPIRVADSAYMEEIWPYLKNKARKRSKDIVKLLDLVVIAEKI